MTPREGQGEIPERGVVEVKGLAETVVATADTGQVSRYWERYRLVLVTNYRDFLLVGVDARGPTGAVGGLHPRRDRRRVLGRVRPPRATAR